MCCFQIINNNDNANNVYVGEEKRKRMALSLGLLITPVTHPWKMIFLALVPHLCIPNVHGNMAGMIADESWT